MSSELIEVDEEERKKRRIKETVNPMGSGTTNADQAVQ